MALNVKVGNFTSNTVTGNQAITGLGFQPKFVFFFTGVRTAVGGARDCHQAFGVAASSTARWAFCGGGPWGFGGGSADKKQYQNTRCLIDSQGFGTLLELDFVSMDSDGFTVNVVTTGGAYIVFYVALGGSDLSVNVGTFGLTTGTGSQAVTGVGFQPDFVGFGGNVSNQTTGESNNGQLFVGFAKSSTSRAVSGQTGSNSNPTVEKVKQIVTACINRIASATDDYLVDFTSMDSNGFTVNKTTAPAATSDVGYFALKGAQFSILTFTQKTSTGNQAYTGVGFQPGMLIFTSINHATGTGIQANGGIMVGAAQSATARGVLTGSMLDNITSNTQTHRYIENTKCVAHITSGAGTTPTVNAEADLVSLDSDGWTLNWTTADATARESIAVAIAQTAGVSTKLKRNASLSGLGASGPFFHDALAA